MKILVFAMILTPLFSLCASASECAWIGGTSGNNKINVSMTSDWSVISISDSNLSDFNGKFRRQAKNVQGRDGVSYAQFNVSLNGPVFRSVLVSTTRVNSMTIVKLRLTGDEIYACP